LILSATGGVDNTRDDGRPQGAGGLVSGHAYSVIQVKEGLGQKLLNIRNPWGEFEWDGPWSDNSPYWTEEMIEEFRPNFDANDGAFWMSLEDFVAKFEEVSICKVENYDEVRFKGKFIKGLKGKEKAESVVSKFYYAFTIESETEMTIGIHQEDERIVGAHLRRYLDIGYTVLRVSEFNDEVHLIELCPLEREREVFKRFILTKGSYVVVPLTSGAYLQNGSQALTAEIPPKIEFENSLFPHPYYNSTLNDIFRKIDLAVNDLLSVEELNQFGEIINEKFFKNITYSDFTSEKYKDISCNEYGVTCLGFKQLLFRHFSSAEITRFMEILGYDKALNSTKSRSFMISFQSDLPLTIKIKDTMKANYLSTAWDQAMSYLYEHEGLNDLCAEEDDYILFAYENPKSYTTLYALINKSSDDLKATLNMNQSISCVYCPSSGVVTKVVPANSLLYL
jgi:hypothetical protein